MKKFNLIAFAVISVFFAYATSVSAAGYGDGGCGLGSVIFGDSPSVSAQSCAATTNGIAYNQLFGITSGTLNCDASGLIVAEKEQEIFMAKNFDNLSREMATGSGEHLDTLAKLMGYTSKDLGSFAKTNFNTIFASDSTSPFEVLTAIREGMVSTSS